LLGHAESSGTRAVRRQVMQEPCRKKDQRLQPHPLHPIAMEFLATHLSYRGVQSPSREQSPSPMNEPLRRAIVTPCVSPPDFFRRQLASTVTACIGNHTRRFLSVPNEEEWRQRDAALLRHIDIHVQTPRVGCSHNVCIPLMGQIGRGA
jgi:hypothetical protein